ncbi:Arf GTPase activating protein [Lasiodiplodia theobromae]|uniref:Arf GTPAse activating protein n=1 Tax=Lasiodiplodia theobromae TaxID=45133 RepID=UPI0015C31CF6|nr:Arf GTPAse activating protein [Lasiodiplodia theobromae]KAF4539278.1 Arf GTPAse activating protein [Lasiodiplodia theobromae]KAF9636458.1 Arf GTPase activating protein [Lasiodiplodia theobromae]
MSRRAPNPAAERAAQNTQTLKSLVKLEANKSCADCKRNKHPRWASWNLGVFICIRCSGIHRGMGTHISRVKSVDLDSWTDEQLQSMLRWGNARANKYWEAKLAPGHIPSESKIENFIRTKYDSKRWVMDGPMPDPATLDAEGDDDVPLNVVQEKAKLERSTSQRAAASASHAAPAPVRKQPTMDIFGDDPPPSRPSTGPPSARAPPPKTDAAPPKQSKPGDSLLGLDFFGSSPSSTPARPASTTGSAPAAQSRPDLKQSILSLYAAKPAAQPVRHQHTGSGSGSFGGLGSPGLGSPGFQQSPTAGQPAGGGFGGMTDAFSSLSFSNTTQPAAKPSPFADLMSATPKPTSAGHTPSGSKSGLGSFGSGGSFFDAPLSKPAAPQAQRTSSIGSGSNFGGFASSSPAASKPAASTSGDLFSLDFGAPAAAPSKPAAISPAATNSAFNLSSPMAPSQPSPAAPQPTAQSVNYASGLGGMGDPWGSNDVWASNPGPAAAPAATTTTASAPAPAAMSSSTGGWGSASTPAVAQDDDFGGWSSAPAPAPAASNPSASKPVTGVSSGDDLFGNPW